VVFSVLCGKHLNDGDGKDSYHEFLDDDKTLREGPAWRLLLFFDGGSRLGPIPQHDVMEGFFVAIVMQATHYQIS
jgi:hypothetical protein